MSNRIFDIPTPSKSLTAHWKERFQDRIYFLMFACQFDIFRASNCLLLIGMACVLYFNTDYLQTSLVLSQLARYETQFFWANVLLIAGIVETALLFLVGNPPLFAETTKQAMYWHIAGACGYWMCVFLFAVLATLLTPPIGGIGFGTIIFGVAMSGNLYGSLRTGRTIAVDREACRLAKLKEIALSGMESTEILYSFMR